MERIKNKRCNKNYPRVAIQRPADPGIKWELTLFFEGVGARPRRTDKGEGEAPKEREKRLPLLLRAFEKLFPLLFLFTYMSNRDRSDLTTYHA